MVDFEGGQWRAGTDPRVIPKGAPVMTLIWFIVWLIANLVGTREPLLFDPVNAWTATLILAIALDLAGAHAGNSAKRRG
jgi:hypothetical protein